MPLLAIVKVGNVRLILIRVCFSLSSIYIYIASIVPIGRARVLALIAIVSLRVRRRERYTLLPVVLLLSFELSIIDRNSIIYIRVERLLIPIDLNELVLNIVLKSVIELSLERIRSLIDSEYKLLELRGILDS